MSLLRRRMMMASSVKEPDVPDTPTEELDYLTIIPLHEEEDTYTIMVCQGSEGGSWFVEYSQLAPLYYRVNNSEWLEFMFEGSTVETISFSINLKKGDELQLKCTTYDLNTSDYIEFYYVVLQGIDAKFNVRGTPMSLIYGDDFKENNIAINACVSELFYLCSGLTEILNPKTFLPCTVLGYACYYRMFYHCTNLVNAPELPATTLASNCYNGMFYGCTKINYIKMLATDISAPNCLSNWVYGVSSTGTFVKHPEATWDVRGSSGVPNGWTIKFDGEESGGGLINFTIDGTSYQAREGMTWEEWVNSSYNTEGFIIDFGGFINMGMYFIGTEEDYVSSSDVILEDYEYLLVM